MGPQTFKRACVTHRNAVTPTVKRTVRTIDLEGRGQKDMLREDVERNVMLCLHSGFCRNTETSVDPLPCCKQRVKEQKCWRTAFNIVRMATDVLVDTEIESVESMSQADDMKS